MEDVDAMRDRQAADLAELAELGMAVARNLAAATLHADTPEEKAKLAGAFHRISRSVRQTHALHAKLSAEAGRERAEVQRRVEAAAAEAARTRANARKTRIRSAVARLIWDEYERDEAEDLEEDLDGLLYCGHLTPDDLDAPDEVLIARIAAELGLKAPPEPPARPLASAGAVEPRPPP